MTKTTYTHSFRSNDPDGDTFGSMLSEPNPHTPAKRYILIDPFTGMVIGHCWAANAIEACREIDQNGGAHHRTYEDIGNKCFESSGYYVYEAPADFCVDNDLNNPWFFRLVNKKLPLVARIATR